MDLFFSENDILFFRVKRFLGTTGKRLPVMVVFFLCLNGVFKSKNHSWVDTWGDSWSDKKGLGKTKCFSWVDTWGDTFN